jgi:hypothetical protein
VSTQRLKTRKNMLTQLNVVADVGLVCQYLTWVLRDVVEDGGLHGLRGHARGLQAWQHARDVAR